ncbi:MAG: hypothetical protein CMD79_02305 [Gammaproteobacteria bacterium]|nr:hypothetical protein [Gammaproteobacteria bacterium]|tara:strand:- start:1186 stop:1662 length:477 start_codon:yes stop_codon:yes gene_type:complete
MSTKIDKYLVLRGKNKDIYFIQKRLSKEQSSILGYDFIKKSLETTDLSIAIGKRDKILSDLDNISKKLALEAKFTDEIDNIRINESNIYKESNDFDKNTDILEKKHQEMGTKNKKEDIYTIFSIKIPKLPQREEIVSKIDGFVPIIIVFLTLFVVLIA